MSYIFSLCVRFLDWLADTFGTTYESISVFFNIYFQGGVMLCLSIGLAFEAVINIILLGLTTQNIVMIILSAIQISIVCLGFERYRPPLREAFLRCVHDLQSVARICHLPYQVLNVIIFIVLYLAIIGFSVYLMLKSYNLCKNI
jgi:hypothetical protein